MIMEPTFLLSTTWRGRLKKNLCSRTNIQTLITCCVITHDFNIHAGCREKGGMQKGEKGSERGLSYVFMNILFGFFILISEEIEKAKPPEIIKRGKFEHTHTGEILCDDRGRD